MTRISELHYSNAYAGSSGQAEFLEIALGPNEDPADFTVSFYQANGSVGFEISLDDPALTPTIDPQNGEVIYVIASDQFPIFLTDPDGGGATNYEAYALTNTTDGEVVDFYDIGGGTQNIVALDGAAAIAAAPGTAVSENLPVLVGPNSTTTSLQFNQPNPDVLVYETVGPGDSGPACFVAGTEVLTPNGPVPVEALNAGDQVITRDNGAQTLVWCGQQMVPGHGRFAPILFRPGHFGVTQDTYVSPQHRVLVTGREAELFFGEPEVLVPAKALLDDRFVLQVPRARVTYCHLLFATHQIINSHGFWSESYYPGAQQSADWSQATQAELLELFPQLSSDAPAALARPCLTVQMGRLLRP